jgi:hypothetical protein
MAGELQNYRHISTDNVQNRPPRLSRPARNGSETSGGDPPKSQGTATANVYFGTTELKIRTRARLPAASFSRFLGCASRAALPVHIAVRRALLGLGLLYLLFLFSIMGVGLFLYGVGFSPETVGDYREMMTCLYGQAERPATTGLGGLVGAVVWSITGHQAGHLFLFRLPRAWRSWAETPWRKKAPGEILPLLKPLALGAVLLIGGAAAAEWLAGASGPAFHAGLWIGGGCGTTWSLYSFWTKDVEKVPKPPA